MKKIYILQIKLDTKKYYVTDLQGSMSRSIQDSMLFINELVAESYAGPIEHLVETKTGSTATVQVEEVPLQGIIPRTPVECIPSL